MKKTNIESLSKSELKQVYGGTWKLTLSQIIDSILHPGKLWV